MFRNVTSWQTNPVINELSLNFATLCQFKKSKFYICKSSFHKNWRENSYMLGLGTDISVDLIIAQKCLRKKNLYMR